MQSLTRLTHQQTSKYISLAIKGAVHGVMDPSTEKGYSAAWVAERVLEAMQRGDQEVKHHSLSCCHLIQFTMV